MRSPARRPTREAEGRPWHSSAVSTGRVSQAGAGSSGDGGGAANNRAPQGRSRGMAAALVVFINYNPQSINNTEPGKSARQFVLVNDAIVIID